MGGKVAGSVPGALSSSGARLVALVDLSALCLLGLLKVRPVAGWKDVEQPSSMFLLGRVAPCLLLGLPILQLQCPWLFLVKLSLGEQTTQKPPLQLSPRPRGARSRKAEPFLTLRLITQMRRCTVKNYHVHLKYRCMFQMSISCWCDILQVSPVGVPLVPQPLSPETHNGVAKSCHRFPSYFSWLALNFKTTKNDQLSTLSARSKD